MDDSGDTRSEARYEETEQDSDTELIHRRRWSPVSENAEDEC